MRVIPGRDIRTISNTTIYAAASFILALAHYNKNNLCYKKIFYIKNKYKKIFYILIKFLLLVREYIIKKDESGKRTKI